LVSFITLRLLFSKFFRTPLKCQQLSVPPFWLVWLSSLPFSGKNLWKT